MTYGRIDQVTPKDDILYRGKVGLCEIPDAKIEDFEKVVRSAIMPSSPMKVPTGYVRRDCQDWCKDVVDGLGKMGIVPAGTVAKLEQVPRSVMLE